MTARLYVGADAFSGWRKKDLPCDQFARIPADGSIGPAQELDQLTSISAIELLDFPGRSAIAVKHSERVCRASNLVCSRSRHRDRKRDRR